MSIADLARAGYRFVALLALLAFHNSVVLAQSARNAGEAPDRLAAVSDVRGEFSVSYAFAILGADAAPNVGPITRADLSFSVGDREVSLRADPVGIRRQGIALEVREGSELFSVSHERTPSDGTNPDVGASSDFQALVVAKPEGAPNVQALVITQSTEGKAGSRVFTSRLAVSDRYRDPFDGVSSVDWRASVQSTNLQVPAAGLERTSVSFGAGAGAAFGGPESRSLRPSLRVDVSNEDAAAGPSTRLRLNATLAAELTPEEDIGVGAGWDFRSAGTADSQSVSFTTTRLEPLSLTAEADRSGSPDGTSSYRWGAGADLQLSKDVRVGASYRGELDDEGSGHGARGRVSARYQAPGFTVRGSLEGGVIWRSDGELRPDVTASLAAVAAELGPVSGSVAGSLRYQGQLSAALNGSFRVDLDRVTLDVDAEISYANALSLSGGVITAVDVLRGEASSLAVQLGIEGRTTAGGTTAASLDLGLRYGFGDR